MDGGCSRICLNLDQSLSFAYFLGVSIQPSLLDKNCRPIEGDVLSRSANNLADDIAVDVAIAGGGMVGMTLGAALAGAGMNVALIDAQPAAARSAAGFDGRSSAIAYGSRQALSGIGVWSQMAAAAQPILDIRVSDATPAGRASRLFLHYDHRDLAGPTSTAQPFGWIIENGAIRTALLRHGDSLSTLRHLAPARVAGLESSPAAVRLALEDGRMVRAALAVAADGRDSPLRQMAGIATTEWSYPQSGIVCTVAHERPHHGVANEHFLPAGPFAMLPMVDDETGRHRSSIVWTERQALAPRMMALDDAGFADEIINRFGATLGRLTPIGGRWSYPLQLVHAARYVGHRLALVGDAAHAIHPIAGQGLNLGLRDVAALAETIVDARRLGLDPGDAVALERYERWRRFDNLLLLAVTDSLNRLFSNDVAPLRLARDLGLALVDRLPPLKRLLMRHAMGTVGDLPRLVRGEPL